MNNQGDEKEGGKHKKQQKIDKKAKNKNHFIIAAISNRSTYVFIFSYTGNCVKATCEYNKDTNKQTNKQRLFSTNHLNF